MTLWQFSRSSQSLLKQCIEATIPDNKNKWIQKFGPKSQYTCENNEILEQITVDRFSRKIEEFAPYTVTPSECNANAESEILCENKDFCRQILELDPVCNINYIIEKCSNDITLFSILAQHLTLSYVEKLCNVIFNTKNINITFVENFCKYFVPEFLKREHTRLSLDLLAKAKANCVHFKYLLEIIIKNVELPSSILQEFLCTFNIKECTEFMNYLSHSDISNDVFIHHLPTILVAYKDCQKSETLQHFMFTKLVQIAQNCINDKTYGRLLLYFLKAERNTLINTVEVEKIINIHKSAFKKPCSNVLEDIKRSKGNS